MTLLVSQEIRIQSFFETHLEAFLSCITTALKRTVYYIHRWTCNILLGRIDDRVKHLWWNSFFKIQTAKSCEPIKCHCCLHIETSQLICIANQLTDFYMRATLAFKSTLVQIWKYPETFVFLILRILELFVREICKFLKKYANF